MLSWLVTTSLHLRIVLLAACALLLVVGYRSIQKAHLDVFPEFAPPIVEVQTEAMNPNSPRC
jgi:Cu/Ag efflux pump CusA